MVPDRPVATTTVPHNNYEALFKAIIPSISGCQPVNGHEIPNIGIASYRRRPVSSK